MSTITFLSREQRGKIIEKFDKGQRYLDEVHAAVLTACGKDVRGDDANALLVEMDRAADFFAEHQKRAGKLFDKLMEES